MQSLRALLHRFFHHQDKLTGGYSGRDAEDPFFAVYRIGRIEGINDPDDVPEAHPLLIIRVAVAVFVKQDTAEILRVRGMPRHQDQYSQHKHDFLHRTPGSISKSMNDAAGAVNSATLNRMKLLRFTQALTWSIKKRLPLDCWQALTN